MVASRQTANGWSGFPRCFPRSASAIPRKKPSEHEKPSKKPPASGPCTSAAGPGGGSARGHGRDRRQSRASGSDGEVPAYLRPRALQRRTAQPGSPLLDTDDTGKRSTPYDHGRPERTRLDATCVGDGRQALTPRLLHYDLTAGSVTVRTRRSAACRRPSAAPRRSSPATC